MVSTNVPITVSAVPPSLWNAEVASLVWELREALFLVDQSGAIRAANPAATQLSGYAPDALTQMELADLLIDSFKSDRPGASGLSYSKEWVTHRLKTRDGIDVSVEINMAVSGDHGENRLVVVRELPTEAGLRELSILEERWKQALESKELGVWDWRIDTNDVYFSNRLVEMLGYDPQDFGTDLSAWEKLVHPDDKEHVWFDINLYVEGKSAFYFNEHRLKCKNGRYKWVQDQGKIIEWSSDGKPRRMVGTHLDVSEFKEIEQHLAERTRQLEAVFDVCPDGFVAVSNDYRVTLVNQVFFELTGINPEWVLQHSLETLDDLLRGRCQFPNAFPGLLALSQPVSSPLARSSTLLHLKAPQPVVLRVIGCTREDAVLDRFIFYFQDVTDASEVDRLKSEFLSSAAHELRTPMASIFGFSELLLESGLQDDVSLDMVQTIYQQASVAVHIINELLDLVRIESRQGQDFKFCLLDVNLIVENIVATFSTVANGGSIRFGRSEFPVSIYADDLKVRQCLSNVLSNACKYSPEGEEITVRILPSNQSGSGEHVGIRVSDQGIGMTKEQVDRIFDRFYRADTSGRFQGTGLGMSILKEIVDLHGGHVDVESKPGSGTSVTLWFPTAVPE